MKKKTDVSFTPKTLIKKLAFKAGLYRFERFFNRGHILAYHMVTDSPNAFYPEISVSDFQRQMDHVAANYTVISLEELATRLHKRKSVAGCLAITFDDGFQDNFTKAFPILSRKMLPATIFLLTGAIYSGHLPWFLQLRNIFMTTECRNFEFQKDGSRFSVPLENAHLRKIASDQAMTALQECPGREREELFHQFAEALGINPLESAKGMMLTWEQIRKMSADQISFGAHTVTHPVLSRLDPAAIEDEISRSKKHIEMETGKAVKAFAYPFGKTRHFTPETPTILKRLGFLCAVTTERGTNTFQTDPYQLRRSNPWPLSLV